MNLALYHHCWVIEIVQYPRKVGYSTENYIFHSTKKNLNYPPQNMRPLSALFGLQFMLPMEKSVTGACANEIIPNG